jgi:hypothetical protein
MACGRDAHRLTTERSVGQPQLQRPSRGHISMTYQAIGSSAYTLGEKGVRMVVDLDEDISDDGTIVVAGIWPTGLHVTQVEWV